MADADPRYPSRRAITPDPRALPHATHPRNASDPAYYSHAQPHAVPQPHMQYYSQGQGQQQGYYQGQSSQYASRNPIASGSYPYSASQPMMRQPVPGSSGGPAWAVADPAASERPSSSRYECSYCGKSFTRPSSLKVNLSN
ncbi:hypothetical protein A0H81_11709 [Grifola frondosa]|uniref:C2H2-type domain-containing protein n=1 Tax=Grifola frondosa TaxID=5627 RepID=A0A1C7LUI8_GRIFR|nr:hypothetical protein A0H81_11709 [Grifola frondosa]